MEKDVFRSSLLLGGLKFKEKGMDLRQQSGTWKETEKVFEKYGVSLAYLFGKPLS